MCVPIKWFYFYFSGKDGWWNGKSQEMGQWAGHGVWRLIFHFFIYNGDNPDFNLNFSSFLGNYITTDVRKHISCPMELTGNDYDTLGDRLIKEVLAQI